ncbi:YopX family protein [Virgibacillus halodenitrificans]|uniref:YopX family protein n=1 Tax=Virgibacillus halodenitrificans TaxID=1482 RepID=UPI001FB1F2E4|nr:YopX family protein [Virgibacillus halodenitrificans]MCJ0932950.1 YopX family protein [Virgibacillus halodenitrificans]
MREIKFKGKAIMTNEELDSMHFIHDNGWFSGNLIQNGNKPWILGDIVESDPEYIVHDFWVRVDPKSVSQYTGLKDKNGQEIFEGDITRDFDEGIISKVKFEDGQFLITDPIYDSEPLCEFDSCIEVIGNIYEHPHLLEGESHV